MPAEYSERGFAQYVRDLPTSYGATISVYESSAAMSPHVWISIDGECHMNPPDQEPRWYSKPGMVGGKPYPGLRMVDGSLSAHLDYEQAVKVRDALTEWIDMVPERWGFDPTAEEMDQQ